MSGRLHPKQMRTAAAWRGDERGFTLVENAYGHRDRGGRPGGRGAACTDLDNDEQPTIETMGLRW